MGKPQTEIDPFRDELRILRKALGNRIRELRRLRGWSQEAFAAKAHVHRTFAGSLERGEKNLSFHALVLIAKCFGMPLGQLLAGLEAGDSVGTGANRKPTNARRGIDRDQVLREVSNLEMNIRALKELAFGKEGPRIQTPKRKPRKGPGRG